MKQILFIINPNSGQKTVEEFDLALKQELEKFSSAGETIQIECLVPESPDAMRQELREKFLVNPVDMIGVVGGDGTIMEVLPLLIEFPSIKLALIPYGTGNLLAVNLGIPKDFVSSLDVLFNGKARRIDLASINKQYFALIAGVGVVADIMENTPREHKKRFGVLAYLFNGIQTIFQAKRSRFTVTTENATYKAKGVAVIVSNAASILGPCLPLTPDAEPDDGLLDVCIIKSRSNRDYLTTVMEILHTKEPKLPAHQRQVINFQARRIKIESSKSLKVQADGNLIGTTPVNIEIIRNRLQIMVPQDVPSPQNTQLTTTLSQMITACFPMTMPAANS